MPLYKLKDVNFDNIPLIDRSHLRIMWSNVIRHANMFSIGKGMSTKIYVSTLSYNIINQSTNFSFRDINSGPIDYVGHFMGWNIFISDELIDDEYVIGLDENEIKVCKRKNKLNKICGLITEEKQK